MAPVALFTNREMVFWQLLEHGLWKIYISFSVHKQSPFLFTSALSLKTASWWRLDLTEPFPALSSQRGHKKGGAWGWMSAQSFFFLILFIYLFIYLAVLGLRFCARAFSSCSERGPLFMAVRGPLTIVASLVAEHRLQMRRLSSCGSRAQSLHGMWDSPRPGLEPVSPAPAGRLPTTEPPGKPSPKL